MLAAMLAAMMIVTPARPSASAPPAAPHKRQGHCGSKLGKGKNLAVDFACTAPWLRVAHTMNHLAVVVDGFTLYFGLVDREMRVCQKKSDVEWIFRENGIYDAEKFYNKFEKISSIAAKLVSREDVRDLLKELLSDPWKDNVKQIKSGFIICNAKTCPSKLTAKWLTLKNIINYELWEYYLDNFHATKHFGRRLDSRSVSR